MSTNPLNDISRVYLEQVASQEVEEGYQPIGREKESAMYRRAGNLARTSLASTGKTKLAAAKKSATIVSAITRQKERERFDSIGQSPSHNEEAKPDYLDFDKDGNEKESMKKALRDKAKKKNLEEAGSRQGGGTIRPPKPQSGSPTPPTSTDRAAVRFGKKTVEEAKKPNDGNLANNYPPYDKVTRGDVIAGRLGKDEMGGKKKAVKEGYSNWREDLREVMSKVEKEDKDVKITEKKVDNKIKTSAMGGGITLPEAVENLGGTLLDVVELDESQLDEKITAKTDMGAAIKDFYASKSPQLAGRTKEERRKAAIAAVLTARRGGKKRVEEQAMELQPKNQQAQPEKPNPALAAKQKQAVNIQKQIEMKKVQLLNKGIPLTQSYEPEGEVIDERRKSEKGTPRAPRNRAFELVAQSMGTGRMGVQPRGVKKEKGAPTPGPSVTPAQKVAKRRAAAKAAQDNMSSRFD